MQRHGATARRGQSGETPRDRFTHFATERLTFRIVFAGSDPVSPARGGSRVVAAAVGFVYDHGVGGAIEIPRRQPRACLRWHEADRVFETRRSESDRLPDPRANEGRCSELRARCRRAVVPHLRRQSAHWPFSTPQRTRLTIKKRADGVRTPSVCSQGGKASTLCRHHHGLYNEAQPRFPHSILLPSFGDHDGNEIRCLWVRESWLRFVI